MTRPNVLVLAGHDPSGGAGLQADIESVAANDGHAATVATLLTQQDTRNVYGVQAVDDTFFARCVDTVLADMPISAIKTGAIASLAQIDKVRAICAADTALPLVIDPVLVASGGGELAADAIGQALLDQLFPLAQLVTPNAREARQLCPTVATLDECGAQLASRGCAVLITGGDSPGDTVINRLYQSGRSVQKFEWPRLPGVFHGSGCTLASAIAAHLALGEPLDTSLHHAQAFVARSLSSAFSAGQGQAIPHRLHAMDRDL